MKKLAVLLPTYNAAAYLNDSIDSILGQTFSDFDLYVYNDCSTDNTAEIISRYKDARIFYRNNSKNSGIAKTLNKGLEELLPQYEYIARMDADDWCYPERFQKQIDFLDQNQHVIVCGTQGYWLKDITQNPVSDWKYPTSYEYIKRYLLFGASFGHSSVVFRSDSFQKKNLKYNESIETCEDWDLWIRIVQMGQVANLPNFLMKYRILENSNHRSREKMKKHFEERSKIISSYWGKFDIALSPKKVYEYYYDTNQIKKAGFVSKIKLLIHIFNILHSKGTNNLILEEEKDFSYILARKILDYWKRSKVSRFRPLIWLIILREVKFMNKIKLVKSLMG